MVYKNIKQGIFLSRPNRFIAHVEVAGKAEVCHVKNTGRCRELLVPGAVVFLQEFFGGLRKTRYDLIAVYKGDRLINMDSQAPNKVFAEWVTDGGFMADISLVKPEYRYKNSRIDFYMESGKKRILAEIKGVTLEDGGVAMFPDAPTERGLKHVAELTESAAAGLSPWVVFIIQMERIRYFTPNYRTHSAFGEALKTAAAAGVKIIALDCSVTPDNIRAKAPVTVRL